MINDNGTKSYHNATISKLEKSRIEITGSIPPEIWGKHRSQALKNINDSITVDGFRKGMVPENILISKVGEVAMLEEMAGLALAPAYMEIITDNRLDVIGRPAIQVTKLAKDNPLEFKITTAIVPEISLPDYKKLAREEIVKQNPDDVKLTDEELETTITSIRKSRAPRSKIPSAGTNGKSPDLAEAEPDKNKIIDDDVSLPALTDDFVKTLGAFDSVSDFKAKLTGMLLERKRDETREKLRIKIADSILAGSTFELPDVLVESELRRTEAQFKVDLEKMNVKLEDYLKHAKKTIDEIRQEWRPHAEKKARLQLTLNAIAGKENLAPSHDEVDHEVKHIMEHYKDADHDSVHIYAETILTNEKVFQFLEK